MEWTHWPIWSMIDATSGFLALLRGQFLVGSNKFNCLIDRNSLRKYDFIGALPELLQQLSSISQTEQFLPGCKRNCLSKCKYGAKARYPRCQSWITEIWFKERNHWVPRCPFDRLIEGTLGCTSARRSVIEVSTVCNRVSYHIDRVHTPAGL